MVPPGTIAREPPVGHRPPSGLTASRRHELYDTATARRADQDSSSGQRDRSADHHGARRPGPRHRDLATDAARPTTPSEAPPGDFAGKVPQLTPSPNARIDPHRFDRRQLLAREGRCPLRLVLLPENARREPRHRPSPEATAPDSPSPARVPKARRWPARVHQYATLRDPQDVSALPRDQARRVYREDGDLRPGKVPFYKPTPRWRVTTRSRRPPDSLTMPPYSADGDGERVPKDDHQPHDPRRFRRWRAIASAWFATQPRRSHRPRVDCSVTCASSLPSHKARLDWERECKPAARRSSTARLVQWVDHLSSPRRQWRPPFTKLPMAFYSLNRTTYLVKAKAERVDARAG